VRAVELILALLLALGVAWATYLAAVAVTRRRESRLARRSRWRMTHHGENGETVVAVSLVRPDGRILDRHEVARVPDHAPDWDAQFLAATQTATERAFHLNGARDQLPP
jgi:hypothetical protein